MGTHPEHGDTFVHAGRMLLHLSELWVRGWDERRWKLGAGDFQGAHGSELHHAGHRDGVSEGPPATPCLDNSRGFGDLGHVSGFQILC